MSTICIYTVVYKNLLPQVFFSLQRRKNVKEDGDEEEV